MTDQADDYGATTARYYDAVYEALDVVGPDAAFHRSLARELGGPVLELGCGTGRVLLEIAADGHHCTGLDQSEGMLDMCCASGEDETGPSSPTVASYRGWGGTRSMGPAAPRVPPQTGTCSAHDVGDQYVRLQTHRLWRWMTGSPSDRNLPSKGKDLPGDWAVLFVRAYASPAS